VLRCVAVCCSVLQCVAACCSVLQRFAACCSVLQCVAVFCSVLQCVAVCCSAFLSQDSSIYFVKLIHIVRDCSVCCSVLQYVYTVCDTHSLLLAPLLFCCRCSRCPSFSVFRAFSLAFCISLTDAVCCDVLRCGAVCCSVVQCVAVCCSVLCSMLQWHAASS